MKNKIFINGEEIPSSCLYKKGTRYIVLLNGIEHYANDLHLETACNYCNKLYHRKIYKHYLNTKFLCDACKKIPENNSFYGKKHSEEFKKRLSDERKGKRLRKDNRSNYQCWLEKYGEEEAKKRLAQYADKMSIHHTGESNPFFGKKHPPEIMNIIIEKGKEYRAGLDEEEKLKNRQAMSDGQRRLRDSNPEEYSKMKRKAGLISNLKSEKYKKNKIEKIVEKELKKRNLKFKYSVILNYFQYDFGCKKYRILLEVQGDYWHYNPEIYLNKTPTFVQNRNIEKDKIKKKWAEDNNFKIFYIWEKDILLNNFQVLEEIQQYINEIQINTNSEN